MKPPIFKDGIPYPPEGLSPQDEAKWWMQNPEWMLMAIVNDTLTPEIKEEIKRVDEDIQSAYRVIDRKKVPGLSEKQRGRMFELLTGGGIYSPRNAKRGRKPSVKQSLKVAEDMEGFSGREANHAARQAAGNKYHGNTSKLKNKAMLACEKRELQDKAIALAIERTIPFINSECEELGQNPEFWIQFLTSFFNGLRDEQPDAFDEMIDKWFAS